MDGQSSGYRSRITPEMEAWTREHLKHCICLGTGYYSEGGRPGDRWFGVAMPCLCRLDATAKARSERLLQKAGITANELHQFTFEGFLPKRALVSNGHSVDEVVAVYNACRAFARRPRGNVVLVGKPGAGKTHLAWAIAGYALQHNVAVYAGNEPDMLDMLREAYKQDNFEAWLRDLKHVGLLVLDDFGVAKETDWTHQTLYQIIDFRYRQRLPMVVTTNKDVATERATNRVLSRLTEGCEVEGGASKVLFLPCEDFRPGKR